MPQPIDKYSLHSPIISFLMRLAPDPHHEEWFFSCLGILILAFIQCFIFPSITKGSLHGDLLTPWLVVLFVHHPPVRSFFLCLLAALILETQAAIPFGLYFCAYGGLGSILYLTRGHISWQNVLPWVVIFPLAEIWIISFEILECLSKVGETEFFTMDFFVFQLLRIAFTLGFGFFIMWKWNIFTHEEAHS
jgi:hypothetical protein